MAGFAPGMEDARLPKCMFLGELLGGAISAGEQVNERMGCFLDDLKVFVSQTHE